MIPLRKLYDIGLLDETLRSRITVDDFGCWDYHGPRSEMVSQYGFYKYMPVHRYVYELLVGAIPENNMIDHLCNHKSCCNPTHLEPVTRRENALRAVSRATPELKRRANWK